MAFVRVSRYMFALALFLAGCGNMLDDLHPDGSDQRPAVQAGTTGSAIGQNAPDFTVSDSLGTSVTLSATLPTVQAVVLYFTMWCPVCDSHMSHLRDAVIPNFPNIAFLAVDYVSGSVAGTRNSEITNGYAGSGFTVLADTNQAVLSLYNATMGTTVVIDSAGVVRMNEDYKDGSKLVSTLGGLP